MLAVSAAVPRRVGVLAWRWTALPRAFQPEARARAASARMRAVEEARVRKAEARVSGGDGEGGGCGGDGRDEDLPRHQVGAALHHEGEVELQRQRRSLWLKWSHVATLLEQAAAKANERVSVGRALSRRRSTWMGGS